MKIFVKAKPNAKHETVEELDSSHFIISVKAPPKNGLANEAIALSFASKEKIFWQDWGGIIFSSKI